MRRLLTASGTAQAAIDSLGQERGAHPPPPRQDLADRIETLVAPGLSRLDDDG
jgi:hypothetical protein